MLVCRREVVKRALDVFSWSIFGWRIVGVPLTPGKVRCVCLVVPHWESSVDLMRCQLMKEPQAPRSRSNGDYTLRNFSVFSANYQKNPRKP